MITIADFYFTLFYTRNHVDVIFSIFSAASYYVLTLNASRGPIFEILIFIMNFALLSQEKYWEENPGKAVPLMKPRFYGGPWRVMGGEIPKYE